MWAEADKACRSASFSICSLPTTLAVGFYRIRLGWQQPVEHLVNLGPVPCDRRSTVSGFCSCSKATWREATHKQLTIGCYLWYDTMMLSTPKSGHAVPPRVKDEILTIIHWVSHPFETPALSSATLASLLICQHTRLPRLEATAFAVPTTLYN